MLCFLTQPKEGQQQIKKTKIKNCQKIELYGSLTTKELKKKHSSRLVGGVETGSQVERTHSKAAAGRPAKWWIVDWAVPHSCADKLGGTTGEVRQTAQPRVPARGNKDSKPLTENTCGGCGSKRNSQPHRRVCWRDPQGSRRYTKPLTWELVGEGPNLLVGSVESD